MNEANLLGSVPDPFIDPAVGSALKTLTIYTSRRERAFHRSLKELKALRTERAVRTNLAGAGDEAEPSPRSRPPRSQRGKQRSPSQQPLWIEPPLDGAHGVNVSRRIHQRQQRRLPFT